MTKQNCIDFSDTVTLRASTPQTWGQWMAMGKLLAVREMRAIKALVHIWRDRHVSRQALKELTPELLDDIGLSHTDALIEANKPFWQE